MPRWRISRAAAADCCSSQANREWASLRCCGLRSTLPPSVALPSFTAQCAPEPGAPPLWCWTQLFQGLRPERTALDPWLVAHLLDRGRRSAPNVDGPSSGFRLYEAVAGALLARADAGPVLLAIDDLQWADAESLAMFGFLARRLATAAILLLGAYRDAEAGPELQAIAGRAEVQTLLGMDDDGRGQADRADPGHPPRSDVGGGRPDPGRWQPASSSAS